MEKPQNLKKQTVEITLPKPEGSGRGHRYVFVQKGNSVALVRQRVISLGKLTHA